MESIGVFWINLKPHLLPCIVSEVDQVVNKHRSLLNSNNDGNKQAGIELEFLNVSIRARIEDFDNYYSQHFQDFRTPFFEKQKFRLRRLLAESMASEGNPYEGDELEIITDEQLQQAKKDTIMSEPRYANYRDRKSLHGIGRIRTGQQLNTDSGGLLDSKKKKARIDDSIVRLSSPPRRVQIAEAEIRRSQAQNEDLVYSIKMTQDEYDNYQKQRDVIKMKDSPNRGEVQPKMVNSYY